MIEDHPERWREAVDLDPDVDADPADLPPEVVPCFACGRASVEERSYFPGEPAKPRCEDCAASAAKNLAAYEGRFKQQYGPYRSPWS